MSGFKKVLLKNMNKECLTKIFQSAIAEAGSGEPAPQTFNGSLQGFIPNEVGVLAGNAVFAHPGWDPIDYPYSGMTIGPVVNPSCGPDGAGFGTLVIDPNIPAGNTIATADFSFEILDNSGGLGNITPFCVTDGRLLGPTQSVPSGGLGTNTAPTSHTITVNFTDTTCPSEDIRFAYSAWGTQSISGCDEINPNTETLVTVTPSSCAGAATCFESWFGCSVSEMLAAEGESVSTVLAKVESLSVPMVIHKPNPGLTPGFKAETWGPFEGGSQLDGNKAEYETRWLPNINGGLSHVSGLPPTTTVLETDTRFSPAERGQDEHKLTYCVHNTSDQPLSIGDSDTRAESLRVYLGCGCNQVMTYERYQRSDEGPANTPYTSDGQPVAIFPPNSFTVMTVYIHDPGPDFSGFRPVVIGDGQFISYQAKLLPISEVIDYNLCNATDLPEGSSYQELTGWDCDMCDIIESNGLDGAGSGGSVIEGEVKDDVAIDNFQDGNNNAPFNLQVRNETGEDKECMVFTPVVLYEEIPDLVLPNGVEYELVKNEDGSIQHKFTVKLAPFQGVTILGGVPSPPGNGGSDNITVVG